VQGQGGTKGITNQPAECPLRKKPELTTADFRKIKGAGGHSRVVHLVENASLAFRTE